MYIKKNRQKVVLNQNICITFLTSFFFLFTHSSYKGVTQIFMYLLEQGTLHEQKKELLFLPCSLLLVLSFVVQVVSEIPIARVQMNKEE